MTHRKVSRVTLLFGALGLFMIGQALFLSNSGCSSGAVCYRVTDCPIGDRCISGMCTHRIEVGNDGTGASSGSSTTGGSSGSGTMTGALLGDAGMGGQPRTTEGAIGGEPSIGAGGMGGEPSIGDGGMSGAAGMGGA